MRRSASLHRTLLTACCSSEEENLLDCGEPRRYGRRASRLLCSVPMSSRLKWYLANERYSHGILDSSTSCYEAKSRTPHRPTNLARRLCTSTVSDLKRFS